MVSLKLTISKILVRLMIFFGMIEETETDKFYSVVFKSCYTDEFKFFYDKVIMDNDSPRWEITLGKIPIAVGKSFIDVSGVIQPKFLAIYLYLKTYNLISFHWITGFRVGRGIKNIPKKLENGSFDFSIDYDVKYSYLHIPSVLYTAPPKASLIISNQAYSDKRGKITTVERDRTGYCNATSGRHYNPTELKRVVYDLEYKHDSYRIWYDESKKRFFYSK